MGLKLPLQTESITRRIAAAGVAVAVIVVGSALGQPPSPSTDSLAAELSAAGSWQEAPQQAALFAPPAHREAYRAFVSPLDLDAVLQLLARNPSLLRTPGGWQPRELLPFDAFGQGGVYDRWNVARLYGSRRARVARGPREEQGAIVESWTLVSPYPDPGLTRLEPGTLLIVLRIP
jgi:hypothetical protein